MANLAEADQPSFGFVPKPERQGFQAARHREGFHTAEQRMRLVAAFQIVIGNSGTEMVNVVKPNVSRKPLEHLR